MDSAALLSKTKKKKVSIVPPCHPVPSTSTQEFDKPLNTQPTAKIYNLPQINLPDVENDENDIKLPHDDSIIEMQNLELVYDIQSVSSNDSDDNVVTIADLADNKTSKLARTREPLNRHDDVETCLSVVIERSDNSESSDGPKLQEPSDKQTHSGIVLSPLQLGQ